MTTKVIKPTVRCSNDRTDGYWPAMILTAKVVLGEDQFIYTYETRDETLVLLTAAASDLDKEPEMRKLAYAKMLNYWNRKFKEFDAACSAGAWD